MAADASEAAREKCAQRIAHWRALEARQMIHRAVEALLEVAGRALLRRLRQAHLDERSPGTVTEPVRDADGRMHTHQRMQTRHLRTLCGAVAAVTTAKLLQRFFPERRRSDAGNEVGP